MENKAPLSGWQRIGVTGRGRARKGVALHWPPAGLQATPNTIAGVGRRPPEPGQRKGAMASVGGQDRDKRFRGQGSAGGCLLGAGRKDSPPPPGPHSSAGKDEVGARNTRPDIYILYVGPSGKFSIPGPRLRQGFPSIPIKERPVSTKSGAQSGCGSVKAGGSEGVRNREREA